ncbi:MAG: penicillin-binding protein activator [Sphingosinicella sp.]
MPTVFAPVPLRRQVLSTGRFALLALAALALAGCGGRARRAPEPPPPAPRLPEPVLDTTCLPAGETHNRVAVLVPLTGTNAALGRSLLNAANLALFDMGGQHIRITAFDTATGAAAAANEAIAECSGLILGPLLADDVRAVAAAARAGNVPVVAFSNDVGVAGGNIFVMGFTPGQSIGRVIAFARERGVASLGGLIPAGLYGQRAGEALNRSAETFGMRLGMVENYDGSQAGIRAAATRLNVPGRHDAILIADGAANAALAAPILRQAAPQPRLLGTERWATEANIGATAGLRGAWFAAPSDVNFPQFRTRYRARYSAPPARLSTLGYDAALLAVRIGGDWPIGRRFPVRALVERSFAGVDGAFRFNRDGVALRALEVREVTATGTTIVSPAPRAID